MKKTDKKLLYISFFVLLLAVVFASIKFIGNRQIISETAVPTLQPTPIAVITFSEYSEPKYGLKLSYPGNYLTENITKTLAKTNPLLAINFVPSDKRKIETDSIFLTIYEKGKNSSPSAWVKENTTPKDKTVELSGKKSFLYYNVSSVTPVTFRDMSTVTYLQVFPDTEAKLLTTVIMSQKYVVLLTHTQGFAEDIYQKMLSSLTITSQ